MLNILIPNLNLEKKYSVYKKLVQKSQAAVKRRDEKWKKVL